MKKINIWVWREMDEEQLKVVENAFGWDVNDFNIQRNITRCSEWELPWVVYIMLNVWIWIIGPAVYDAIKTWIKYVLSSSKMNNRGSIVIKEKSKQYVFGKNQIFMQSKEKEIVFKSLDECFDYMKKQDQN